MKLEPVTLEGRHVRLEPLTRAHLPGLIDAGRDSNIFRWMPVPVRNVADIEAMVDAALADQAAGSAVPFATVERATGQIAGSSRFMAIDTGNRRVEIGWTWIAPAWQRTAVNSEAKRLMLSHAFETWRCNRVEFKTDSLNVQSRSALARLGAVEEGTFRNHMIVDGGARLRHSVYFSITPDEWPAIKTKLTVRL
jgi:RimJ/RimL family protein N-acetyltransferase